MPTGIVLVVDDERFPRRFLNLLLTREGFTVLEAETTREADRLLAEHAVDLIFLDLLLPGETGMEWLARLEAHASPSRPEIVMMSGHGSIQAAVEAMRLGAADFLQKPFDAPEVVLLVVERVLTRRALAAENRRLKAALGARFGALVGQAPAMKALYEVLERTAPLPVTVLIQGESGTGKELVARTLHERSPRRDRPFVAVNCGAIPPALVESTLFGHEKGAFTGADRVRKGVFEEADGGTLFLDELGDMSPDHQVGLLRVLQEQSFARVGGHHPIKVDVRVIAATHRDLQARVREGLFREDLYYRLAVVQVRVPPLRERLEDLPLLTAQLLKKAAERFGLPEVSAAPEVLAHFAGYGWPGNVRQLENVVQRMVVLGSGPILRARDVPDEVLEAASSRPATERSGSGIQPSHPANPGPLPISSTPAALSLERLTRLPLAEARAEFETAYLQALLDSVGGNVRSAAELAGIARQHLYRRITDYGLRVSEEG